MRSTTLVGTALLTASLSAAQPCVDGRSAGFPCHRVDLLSRVTPNGLGGETSQANDLWGWTDPASGREFALVGLGNGTAFVEITNPSAPTVVGHLASHSAQSPWRDIKVYGSYAYIVSEAPGHGMQVFALAALLDVRAPPVRFTETAHYAGGGLGNAHNIAVDEDSGFAFVVGSNTCGGGLHAVDLRTPRTPRFAGCFAADGYTHDAQCVTYRGADPDHSGRELCFAFNEDTVTIVDVTDKSNARSISRSSYPGVAYTHQGWLTDDHFFLLLGDELDEEGQGHNTRTRIWDVVDLDRPQLIGVHDAPTLAIDHNLYVRGDFVYQANYRAGLQIYSLAEIANGRLLWFGSFDVYPPDDRAQFNGAWSVYPFFPSGVIVVSSIEDGLFVLEPVFSARPQ